MILFIILFYRICRRKCRFVFPTYKKSFDAKGPLSMNCPDNVVLSGYVGIYGIDPGLYLLSNSSWPTLNVSLHVFTPWLYCGGGANLSFIKVACVPISVVNTEYMGVTWVVNFPASF